MQRVLGITLARQGRLEEACDAIYAGIEAARNMPYPYLEARSLEAAADIQNRKGNAGEAKQCLASARAIFERLGVPELQPQRD
jgi:hypothetical protein